LSVVEYTVDSKTLKRVAQRIFNEVPKRAMKETLWQLANETANRMFVEAPVGALNPDNPRLRGIPMRNTIKIKPEGKGYFITPTKLVGGYNLATLIAGGSKGRTYITPKLPIPSVTSDNPPKYTWNENSPRRVKTWLKFFWHGKLVYAKLVKRGTIKPNNFIQRTGDHVMRVAVDVVREVFLKHFKVVK